MSRERERNDMRKGIVQLQENRHYAILSKHSIDIVTIDTPSFIVTHTRAEHAGDAIPFRNFVGNCTFESRGSVEFASAAERSRPLPDKRKSSACKSKK
ncbi:hypothetical protein KGM_212544 [Danaus plexippus plexippus]|uniref:Uncharacterized protein n=1 Tax=Danaus plexippus plexippus TaxID=278856 RepID=A0A212FA47_DANPL|nr:hypothetical protein KGM_212544 [Danaus plexippus plexippus]